MPPYCGVGSAAGLLHADLAVERAKTFLAPIGEMTSCSASSARLRALSALFTDLETAARTDLALDADAPAEITRSVGVRFIGQAHAFTLELPSGQVTPELIGRVADEFFKRYNESYGIALRDPAEVTTARVRVSLPGGTTTWRADDRTATAPRIRTAWVDGEFRDIPVQDRSSCAVGQEILGPCILTEPQCSLLVPPGWRATVDALGAVLLEATP